jgi:hypothetical protein
LEKIRISIIIKIPLLLNKLKFTKLELLVIAYILVIVVLVFLFFARYAIGLAKKDNARIIALTATKLPSLYTIFGSYNKYQYNRQLS